MYMAWSPRLAPQVIFVGVESFHRLIALLVDFFHVFAALRKTATAIVNKLKALKISSATVQVPGSLTTPQLTAFVQSLLLSAYAFDRYITSESKLGTPLSSINFIIENGEHAKVISDVTKLCECTVFARDITNERADEMHPARLHDIAKQIAAISGMEVHVCGSVLLLVGVVTCACVICIPISCCRLLWVTIWSRRDCI